MAKHGRKIVRTLANLLVVVGIVGMLYPMVSELYNARAQQAVVDGLEEVVEGLSGEQYAGEWEKVQIFNDNLSGDPLHDPFLENSGYVYDPDMYEECLNLSGDGVMGQVRIPVIDVSLPIYHGTSEEVLAKGVGHMPQTSLPGGGSKTCCVLTGHRGLSSATLFTNLDKLQEGDEVYIKVLNETLAYSVTYSEVVDPADVSSIRPEEGVDELILVTCTPYMINSHRLLVHAERCDYDPETEQAARFDVTALDPRVYAAAVALVVVLWMFASWLLRRRRRKKAAKAAPVRAPRDGSDMSLGAASGVPSGASPDEASGCGPGRTGKGGAS